MLIAVKSNCLWGWVTWACQQWAWSRQQGTIGSMIDEMFRCKERHNDFQRGDTLTLGHAKWRVSEHWLISSHQQWTEDCWPKSTVHQHFCLIARVHFHWPIRSGEWERAAISTFMAFTVQNTQTVLHETECATSLLSLCCAGFKALYCELYCIICHQFTAMPYLLTLDYCSMLSTTTGVRW